jgi:hypothetical protein
VVVLWDVEVEVVGFVVLETAVWDEIPVVTLLLVEDELEEDCPVLTLVDKDVTTGKDEVVVTDWVLVVRPLSLEGEEDVTKLEFRVNFEEEEVMVEFVNDEPCPAGRFGCGRDDLSIRPLA